MYTLYKDDCTISAAKDQLAAFTDDGWTTSPIAEPNEPKEPNEPNEPKEPNEPNEQNEPAAPLLRGKGKKTI